MKIFAKALQATLQGFFLDADLPLAATHLTYQTHIYYLCQVKKNVVSASGQLFFFGNLPNFQDKFGTNCLPFSTTCYYSLDYWYKLIPPYTGPPTCQHANLCQYVHLYSRPNHLTPSTMWVSPNQWHLTFNWSLSPIQVHPPHCSPSPWWYADFHQDIYVWGWSIQHHWQCKCKDSGQGGKSDQQSSQGGHTLPTTTSRKAQQQ